MTKILLAIALMCLVALPIPAKRSNNLRAGAEEDTTALESQNKSQKQAAQDKQKAGKILCLAIVSLIQSGMTGYSDIKSSRDFDDSDSRWIAYESAITFPGSKRCLVYTDRETGNESFVTCHMAVPPDKATGDAFKKWNEELITAIKPCIPKGWTPHTDDQPHPEGYFSMEEGSPGPRIEIGLASTPPGKPKELLINFYRR
jgi:hypothetical protein